VTEDGNYSAKCKVTVVAPLAGISLNKTSLSLNEGKSQKLTVTYNPSNTTDDKTVKWSTTDQSVAIISDGTVTAVKAGTATITAKVGNKTATCKVTVKETNVAVTGIKLDQSNVEMNEAQDLWLTATVLPENAANKNIIWTVSPEGMFNDLGDGHFFVYSAGTGQITATTEDGKFSAVCKVTAKSKGPSQDNSVLKEGKLTILPDEKHQLTVNTELEGLKGKKLSWTSSNKEHVTVDQNGMITGKKPGRANIDAKVSDELSGRCRVQVQYKDVTNPEDFYYDYVYDMTDDGIVQGYSDATFRPYADCNRASIVTFLWRLSGKPEPKRRAGFSDMTGNSDFDKAIAWAAENDITTGWKDNTFRPWTTCNRAAAVTFLWRAAGKPKPEKMAAFNDLTGNSDFDNAISWAAEKGITIGYSDNTFKPWKTCNRLAIVSFLSRYAGILSNRMN